MKFSGKLDFFRSHTVVNWHEHVWFDANGNMNRPQFENLVEHAKLVGMDTLVVSLPITSGHAAPETIERGNNIVAEAMALYPDMVRGYVFVDPVHGKYAVKEIERCVKGLGMVGVKLYHQYTMDDDMQNPIIEKCIELDIPILMHAGKLCQVPDPQPTTSNSVNFVNVARKYPEARIIMAHIGGGGDWNWELKGMAECPNIFTDVSGSVYDSGMIEQTVRVMGADRVLFGTDGSFSSSIGKVLGAEITEDELATILSGPRFAKYLERGCK